jgi:MoaA/NifB/PqqE/SkfB family radical SAM enzyme
MEGENLTFKSLPILVLYPVNTCNSRCQMCGSWKLEKASAMQLEDVIDIANQAKEMKLQQVVFSGGEPLLHPDIVAMCKVFYNQGAKVTLLTNGLLLTKMAKKLTPFCHEIIVSLDGTEEIHNSIRNVPNAFEKLKAGIFAIKNQDNKCSISARITVQKLNISYLRAAVDTAHHLGLDKLSFLAVTNEPDTFNQGLIQFKVETTFPEIHQIERLKNELNMLTIEYSEDFKSGFIAESPEKLKRRLLQYFSAFYGLNDFPSVKCNAPFFSAVIETNGDLLPCFFHNSIGNVFKDGGLLSVLNGSN